MVDTGLPKRVLSLAVVPLRVGELIVTTPVQVYYHTSLGSEPNPVVFDPNDAQWSICQSDCDYGDTNELLNQLQDARVAGETLREFVWYNGVSMWQFLPSYIWPFFFRAVELIKVVGQIMNEVNPEEIRVFPVDDYTAPVWYGAVQAIGQAYGIPVVCLQVARSHFPSSPPKQFRNLLRRMGVGQLIHGVRRAKYEWDMRWLGGQKAKGNLHPSAGKKLLYATIARHWVGIPGDSDRQYDEQIYPLLPALRAVGWTTFLGIDCPYGSFRTVARKLRERMRDAEPGVIWRSFYSYGKMGDLRVIEKKAKAIFSRQWKVLQSDTVFAEDFRYRGVSLWSALGRELKHAFLHTLPECAQMLAIARQIIAEERPDAVIATYETGPFQRALIIQAGRAGIPTVGLMHGMIFDNHYDYMHRRISTDPTGEPLGSVVPEVTCVWGPFWQRNLTEAGHYPSGAVVVTGNWRYDQIRKIAGNVDIPEIKQSFGIMPGKKVVLILSANQSILDYIRQCLQVLASWPDCKPLIKLHPADDPAPVREMLRQMGYPAETLIEGRLIEALTVADLVVSQVSTVVSEAVLLDKPVVLVDFQNMQGWSAYVEAGVCLYATNPAELASAIEQGLNDPSVRARMSAARPGFIERYFYRVDGCAAERVVAALEERLRLRRARDEDAGSER